MWSEDLKLALRGNGFTGSVVAAIQEPDARQPGGFSSDAHQLLDYGFLHAAGVQDPSDFLDLAVA